MVAWPQNSQYQVILDDKNVGTFDANRQLFRTQVVLYHADNLGPGNHTLTFINAGQSASLLEIDYASVFQETPSDRIQPSPTSTIPTASDFPSRSSQTNVALTTGIIIITTVTVLFILALIFLVWFLNRRNKALWTRLHKNYMVQNQFDSPPPMAESLPSRATATHGSSSRFPTETSESSYHKGYLYDPTPSPQPQPEPPPQREQPIRSDTVNTESTLVAENGSLDEPIARQVTLKLVPKWGALGRIRDSPTIVPSRASSMKRPLLSEISEGSAEDDITQADSPVEDFEGDLGSYSPPPYRRLVVSPRGPRYR